MNTTIEPEYSENVKRYIEMLDRRSAAMKTVSDKITESLFFEYHLVSCQLDGYIITSIDESKDAAEKYIWAFHRDSHKTQFIAISMDGHPISESTIEEKGENADSVFASEYSEWFRMNLIENIHLDDHFENIQGLPVEIANIKIEADRVLIPYDKEYFGDDDDG